MPKENEWKELDIANLPEIDFRKNPSDCYAIEYLSNAGEWEKTNHAKWWMILRELEGWDDELEPKKYRYRKRAPEAPTHEEIMTKWWKSGTTWYKPTAYDLGNDKQSYYLSGLQWVDKVWFVNMESADIPPEAK